MEPSLYYWFRDKRGSQGEIDFVIKKNNDIIPIEVRAGKTGSIKSLKLFVEEKLSHFAIRLDLKFREELRKQIRDQTLLYNLPVYGVEYLKDYLLELEGQF